jgi:hypothetical protein
MSKYIWGILTRKAKSEERALKNIENMKNCPYLIAIGHSGKKEYSVYMVPQDKRWWLEYPLKINEKLGEEKFTLEVIENLTMPEELITREETFSSPPCGEDCEICDLRVEYSCSGCLAVKSR